MTTRDRSPRFFVEQPLKSGEIVLGPEESHHLMHVLRIRTGESVRLFDGLNQESAGVVVRITRHEAFVEVFQPEEVDRELDVSIAIAVGLPKGDRQKLLVEKLTEIGVARLIPLRTERGVAQPVDSALTRLGKQVIAASRQCERNRLMQIAEPVDIEVLLSQGDEFERAWFCDPDVIPNQAAGGSFRSAIVAIGPEGGWSERERKLFLESKWQGMFLGRSILRLETAAIVAAARLALPLPPGW